MNSTKINIDLSVNSNELAEAYIDLLYKITLITETNL